MPNTFDNLDLLIYLDENLMTGLNSMVLNGVIQSRTVRRSNDKGLYTRAHLDNRQSIFDEEKKDKQLSSELKVKKQHHINSLNKSNEIGSSLENRFGERFEEELKTIVTSFNMHSELKNFLLNTGTLTPLKEEDIINCNVTYGDYVEVCGMLTEICIAPYIDTLISLLNCHTVEKLNKLINNENLGLLNYGSICKMLETLKDLVCAGGTQDFVIMCGKTPIIIPSTLSYFINNTNYNSSNPAIHYNPNFYIFDKTPCKCKVFGKVLSHCNKNENLSLFRKSTQAKFYENFMTSIIPYLDVLSKNNIPIPTPYPMSFSGPSLLLLPISICI
ncbi:hypothetical protein [Clostridium tarantellae]|uniref:Uncharacterized protein n=1 Tax=Clostridium tarantellae TaxID=39493 RepID=A0A6I1MMB4_9CLOT|nr:hypothetical protein [Clostridium tarantellae]MPQ44120.1 hypothetical protein [Clostridium tarantellae]